MADQIARRLVEKPFPLNQVRSPAGRLTTDYSAGIFGVAFSREQKDNKEHIDELHAPLTQFPQEVK